MGALALGLPTSGVLIALLALGGCGSSEKPPNNNGNPDAMSGVDAAPGDAGGGTDGSNPADDAMGADAAPTVAVYINEVVTSPRHDWGHTSGDGAPFDGTPGDGRISSADQYIELYNAGTTTVDMRNWTIEMNDSGSDTATLSEADTDIVVSAGSSLGAVKPGAFVLVGNPTGTMGNDVYIVLKDNQGFEMDDVEIGGVERDAEGDGATDGAPSATENGFARGAFDEAIARPAGRADTDNDQADFIKMYATPLAANEMPALPNETVPPDVALQPVGSSFEVTRPIAITFDEAIAAASVDGNITLSTAGGDIPVKTTTFLNSDTVVVINTVGVLPFDTDITITVRGGASGLTDLAGNPLAADQQFTIHTESAPSNPAPVLLNELCIKALRDWDHSAGPGVPFDGTAGVGDVSSSDEWIELLVKQDGLDLSGYQIEVFNGPSLSDSPLAVTPLAGHEFVRFVGTGTTLDTVVTGDRVIIGNPIDSMNDSIFVALRDTVSGALVDVVEVGGNIPEEDRGGDGIENGAPGPGLDGDSSVLADEVIARIPDGTDTGDDAADWSHATATMGDTNASTIND